MKEEWRKGEKRRADVSLHNNLFNTNTSTDHYYYYYYYHYYHYYYYYYFTTYKQSLIITNVATAKR